MRPLHRLFVIARPAGGGARGTGGNRTILVAALLALAAAAPVAAELPSKELLDSRADELGTSNSSSRRARQVLSCKFQGRFAYPTLVVGIEKARQERIRAPGGGFRSPREEEILHRLRAEREAACAVGSPTPLQERQCKLAGDQVEKAEGYFDDGKRAFVSHVVSWQTADFGAGNLPYGAHEVVYSAYVDCADERSTAAGFDCGRSAYDNGWTALESLERRVEGLLTSAEPRFTHLLVIANGWNTTQGGALERAGETAKLIGLHAKCEREFRPLVIAVTWHSGWSWRLAETRFLKLLPMVASYGNKAKDADEIGLTWANELLNRHLLPVADRAGIPVVAIGHSFGARMLTRAAVSGHLIDSPPDAAPVSLMVALQGAFSMNRFLPERCPAQEGAP